MMTGGAWLLGYLLLFGILTLQDRLSGPQPVPYTEFKNQVAAKNVQEVFARGFARNGQLRVLDTGPSGSRTIAGKPRLAPQPASTSLAWT